MTEAARRGERRETQGRDRLDLYRAHAAEYEASREPSFVDVGPAVYLALDGEGPHGGSEFQEATAVLYNIALAIKMRRRAAGQDYATTGLEALWPEGPGAPRWRLLIRIPEFIGEGDIERARGLLGRSRASVAAAVRLERLEEGRCVQGLHVGPYGTVPETVRRMRAFAETHGYRFCGAHHQLYVTDPRRVPPPRLRTVLRQPVRPAAGPVETVGTAAEEPASVDTSPRSD